MKAGRLLTRASTIAITDSDRSTIRAPSTGAVGSCTIVSVTPSTRTVNIAGHATDMTALDTGDSWASGGVMFFESNGTKTEIGPTTELAGLDAWSNMSGTWFNIATGTYSLWNAQTYSTSTGVISFGKIVEAAELAGAYGAVKKLVVLCSLKAYSVLNTDIAAMAIHGAKESKGSLGVNSITFRTSVGELEILPHPFQSDGMIHMFAPDECLRTGSTDIKFIQRGDSAEDNNIIVESATTPAGEMRTMSNQQLFIEQPRHLVLMSGITFG